jgi:hypothetical protein
MVDDGAVAAASCVNARSLPPIHVFPTVLASCRLSQFTSASSEFSVGSRTCLRNETRPSDPKRTLEDRGGGLLRNLVRVPFWDCCTRIVELWKDARTSYVPVRLFPVRTFSHCACFISRECRWFSGRCLSTAMFYFFAIDLSRGAIFSSAVCQLRLALSCALIKTLPTL